MKPNDTATAIEKACQEITLKCKRGDKMKPNNARLLRVCKKYNLRPNYINKILGWDRVTSVTTSK